jgi:hypothetical protein
VLVARFGNIAAVTGVGPSRRLTDSRQLRRWQPSRTGRAGARRWRGDRAQVGDAPAASAARRGSAAGVRGPYGLGAPDTTRTGSLGAYDTGTRQAAARRSRARSGRFWHDPSSGGRTDSRQLRRWQARGAGRATARAGRADRAQVEDAPAASAARRGSGAGAHVPYGLGAPDTTRTGSRGAYDTGTRQAAARRSRARSGRFWHAPSSGGRTPSLQLRRWRASRAALPLAQKHRVDRAQVRDAPAASAARLG